MLKSVLLTLGKLSLAALLIGWLARSGQLDFAELRRLIDDPTMLSAVATYFVIAICFLGTWRWKTLLEGAGYVIAWKRAVQLQLTGLFFSTIMPGAVGGDVIKIAYVIRDNPKRSKTLAAMTAFLDRVVGLAGLFLISWILVLINFDRVSTLKGIGPILTAMTLISLGILVFFFASLYHYKGKDPFLSFLRLPLPGFKLIEKLYESLRVYRYARGAIITSILMSVAIQSMALLLFYFFALKILGPSDGLFGRIAVVYPIGILPTAVPLAPAGVGVGHVAFDQLFKVVGLDHGANVFNLYVLSQLLFNMLGAIPYLSLKKLPLENDETAAAPTASSVSS